MKNYFDMSDTTQDYRTFENLIKFISVFLVLAVALLFNIKLAIQWPFDVYLIPYVNALLNGSTAVLLIMALAFIKMKNVKMHTMSIYLSMVFSLLFLVGYILYHVSTEHTSFGGTGSERTIYFALLISHIILAAIQAPFVLYAFMYGVTGQIEKHKKVVKYSYPIWLYVSVTGVICYLMILPYYPSSL